ncbi:MAG: type II toxin-antitoxin system Phd/YefM family antitoxin [Verrucomicrobia bacterium]|nr:type II toxin-antitoxin system Phd/YefM family antitoxin [Verrucomicrobiota bacterium]
MRNVWQLQIAKNGFSRVANNAVSQGAEIIIRHGEPIIMVISVAEYKELQPKRKKLVEVLQACPVKDLGLKRVLGFPNVPVTNLWDDE